MGQRNRLIVLALLLLLAIAVGVGIKYTGNSDQATTLSRRRNRSVGEQQAWASQRSFETARQFTKLENTRDEDRLAQQALQTADHELDISYTTAMREAELNPAPASPQTKELRARIRQLNDDIKAANNRVVQLSAAMNSGKGNLDQLQEQLDLAEAQLTLYTEELEDAKQDLTRMSDDVESRVQRLLDSHKSAFHTADLQPPQPGRLPTFSVPPSLAAQIHLLLSLRSKKQQLWAAQQTAQSLSEALDKQHNQLEKTVAPSSTPAPDSVQASHATQMADLARLAEQRKLLSDYDRRHDDQEQLAQVYGNWITLLGARQIAAFNGVLRSVLFMLLIAVLVVLADTAIDRYYGHSKAERRRLLMIRMMSRFAVRFLSFVFILLVIFGPPNQISTIIGLATAGLTLALKDFVVAFLGWFVLMGRNGIRVGDWVEINGISGEVVEIGLLRTVLLETGNWTDSSHPTGRRVTFVNSFAIERHFFNFSTAGQWLWDTLEIQVPPGRDPHTIVDAIRKLVTEMTTDSVRLAEQEWHRATHRYGMQAFSATPSIDIRPTGLGVIVNVRYITRAQERYEVRSKLYQAVVEMLHNGQHLTAGTK